MVSKTLQILLATALVLASTVSWAYDKALAESYAKLFEPVAGAKAGKALHVMPPKAFVENIKQGKQLVALDVRTPAEIMVFTMILPGSLAIPASELFKAKNLDRLPTDKPVVVICKSGTRATAVATALRHIGFNNAYILKGGFKMLSVYLDQKTANILPKS